MLGHIARFAAVDGFRYRRGSRVICRTNRGVETGHVLSAATDEQLDRAGVLLRLVTAEDELLLARLAKHKNKALEACSGLLAERNIETTLLDAEPLFDGSSIFFYFLGEVTNEIDAVMTELAELYESKVGLRKFAETLVEGCGPGCGTEDAENGCKTGACSTCAVAVACASRMR